MDQLLEEAREAYANESIRQEAREISEEFLSLENEVLDIAEDFESDKLQHEVPGEKWWK